MRTLLFATALVACAAYVTRDSVDLGEAPSSVRRVSDRVERVGERIEAEVEQSVGRFEERINRVGARIDRLGERLDRAGERADRAGDQVGRSVEAAAAHAERLGDQIGAEADRLGNKTGERFDGLGDKLDGVGGRLDGFGDEVAGTIARIQNRLDRQSVRIRIGREYVLPQGRASQGPVVALGGSTDIDGRVDDDVIVVGGRLRLGPHALVRGDLMTAGARVDIDPAATIRGDIKDAAPFLERLSLAPLQLGRGQWLALFLAFTALRMMVALLCGGLLTLVASRRIGNISNRLAGRPFRSMFTGLAGQAFLLPGMLFVTVVLAVSVVGLPLLAALPFVAAGFGLLWTAGFAGSAARTGAALRRKAENRGVNVLDFAVGFIVLSMTTLGGFALAVAGAPLPVAIMFLAGGMLIEYVAWTAGLGAALGSSRSAQVIPPPIPRAATAS